MDSLIVFDLDGTLITCENKQKYVLFSILNSIGPMNLGKINEWWAFKQNGYNTEKALAQIGIPYAQRISQEWALIIEDFTWCSLDMPFDDSISSLEFLKETNRFRIILLTARKSKLQPFQTIQRIGLTQFIDDIVVVNPENAVEEKEFFLRKYKPLMFIGDTESDYNASLYSKTRFVALNRGQRSHTFLKLYGIPHIENNLKFLRHSD